MICVSRWQLLTVAVYLVSELLPANHARLQSADDSCGAASLAYLIELAGGTADEASIADEVRLADGGTNFGLLRDAAKRRGFAVEGARHAGRGNAPFPAPSIAHLEEQHFVVVEFASTDQVRIFDPAFGRLAIPSHRFSWIASGFWIRISREEGKARHDANQADRSDTCPSPP